ncbi:DUF7779 domain-containing protein [Streptomyces sp. NPDC055134]
MDETPRARLKRELEELREASKLTYGDLIRFALRVDPQSKLRGSHLSSWFNGKSVPRGDRTFYLLIDEMERKAKRRRQPRGRLYWKELRDDAAATPRTGTAKTDKAAMRVKRRGPRCRVGVIPRRAYAFQDRLEAEQLAARPTGANGSATSIVLTGLGGLGKTQIAAEYARSVEADLDVLLWITATSRSAIVTAYAEAASQLYNVDPQDPERAAQQFLQRLDAAGQPALRWLIVLDNLADNEYLKHPDYAYLLPPAGQSGRTVITTRRRETSPFPEEYLFVDVPAFDNDTAVAYLDGHLSRRGRHHESTDQLSGLASDLGHLPLALAQAAAYLVTVGMSCAEYRRRWASTKMAMLLPDHSSLPDGQAMTVATTWAISIEYANRLSHLAEPMLSLTAMLAPDGIPHAVLHAAPARKFLASAQADDKTPTEQLLPSTDDSSAALRALHRLSLIDHDATDPASTVRVHRLVQHATRDALAPDLAETCARSAADALCATWNDDACAPEPGTRLDEALRVNALALIGCANDALWDDTDAHAVVSLPGISLGGAGHFTAATGYFEKLVAEAKNRLGDHSDVLRRFRRLHGQAQRVAGDARGAVTTLTGVTDEWTAMLQTSAEVGMSEYTEAMRHLALAQGDSGERAAALDTLTALLHTVDSDSVPPLGLLRVRHEYAMWLLESGQTARAREAYELVLEDKISLLGPEDVESLITRFEIARLKMLTQHLDEAAADFKALLPTMRRVLGPEDPQTLKTMEEAAHCQAVAEQDPRIAFHGLTECLAVRLRTQEATSPAVLHTRMNLIMWRSMTRIHTNAPEWDGADQDVEDMRRLLDDMEKALSPETPMLNQTRRYLTQLRKYSRYVKKHGPATAALLFKQPLTITTVHRSA